MYDYCSPGYYRTGNSCSKCDADIECPGGVDIECSAGLFAHTNGQCLPYAENDPGVPGDCHSGYYDTGDICAPCPENSTCVGPDAFQCNAGFYKNSGACDICPENSKCPAASAQITCLPGYWLNGNACETCGDDAYCHDNIRYPCPAFDPDNFVLSDPGSVVSSWGFVYTPAKPIATSVENCVVTRVWVKSPRGEYALYWPGWSEARGQYYSNTKYWHTAATGYYLSSPDSMNLEMVYLKNLNCTNAPEHATYTGPGSPEGNDCPWKCDDGYMRDGDICTTCPAGYVCVNGLLVCPPGEYADGMECMTCPEFYDARSSDGAAPQSVNECQIKCDGGTYLAAANATECTNVGAGFWNAVNYTNYGSAGTRNQCPGNLTTVGYGAGADSAGDCGRVLHVGKYSIWLHTEKRTSPSLSVQYGNHILYGDMSPGQIGGVRIKYNDTVYSVHNSENIL